MTPPPLAGPLPAAPDVAPVAEPTVEDAVETPWRVVLYDDDVHTFDEVIVQLMKATGCSERQAERHAFTVDAVGKDCVYQGDFFECFQVQGVLREIQLVTEIEG